MDDYRQVWGERIKAARKAQDWTQADLAREVGISHQMVASIEQATRVPSDALRIRLAAALDVDVHTLFSYEQEPAA